MFLPPETLPDVALLTLIFSGMSRVLLIVPSCVAILRLFGVQLREGIRLFRSLEVPGLGAFVRQELVLATLPFIALAFFLLYTENDLLLTDLTNPQRVVTFGVFILWIVLDVFRSHTAGAHLRMMASETKSFGKKMAVSALDGLRYAVYLRPSVSKTAAKLGARAAIGLAQKRVKEHDEEHKRTPASLAAMIFLERFVSFPERIVGRVADYGKERLEAKWEDAFVTYASRAWWKNMVLIIWGFVPTFWLLGMTVGTS
jgi:uncharacterized membrane protein